MRVLVMGLTRELHLAPGDALELADQLVKRAASLRTDGNPSLGIHLISFQSHVVLFPLDFAVLQIERLELIDALLNLCSYRHPENISLPKGCVFNPVILRHNSMTVL